VKLKLNFKADEPTVNGRIYPKEVLKKAFEHRYKTQPVYICDESSYQPMNIGIDISHVIGKSPSYEIRDDGTIILDVIPYINADRFSLLGIKGVELTTCGIGHVEEDGITIDEDFLLQYMFVDKNSIKGELDM